MENFYAMQNLQQKQQNQGKTPIEKMADALAGVGDVIREKYKIIKDRLNDILGADEEDETLPHTPNEDDREIVLPALVILGPETKEKIVFLKTLHEKTGLEIEIICDALKDILSKGLSVDKLMNIDMDDAVAVFKMWKMGRLQSTSVSEIYSKLPVEIVSRTNVWVTKMMSVVKRPALKFAIANGGFSGATTLEDVLRFYTALSADDVVNESMDDIKTAYELFSNVVELAGGYAIPISTLEMTAIWASMLDDMLMIAPLPQSNIDKGAVFLSLWISMSVHMMAFNANITTAFGELLNAASEKSSEKVKTLFYSFYELLGGDSMNAKKYLAWNKTAGVLIEKENLNMSGTTRMMTTFTMGKSFIRSLTYKMSILEFLRGIVIVPGKRTIHDLLTLYRLPEKYDIRTDRIYMNIDGMLKDKISENDMKITADCYCELLKLKLAYMPDDNNGKDGVILDPQDAFVDPEIIDKISIKVFSNKKKNLYNWIRRLIYKKDLQLLLLQSPNKKYLEYFGEPSKNRHKVITRTSYE